MANAQYSVLLESLLGKAGNTVFVMGKNGPYVKHRVSPKNPKSPAQLISRQAFAGASAAYKTLTPEQVAAWAQYASSLSPTIHHPPSTAFATFTKLTSKFLLINPAGTIPTNPPTTPFLGNDATFIVTTDVGTITFTANHTVTGGIRVELLLQPLANANRKPSPREYRTQMYANLGITRIKTLTVPPGAYAAAIRFVKTSTGQQTALTTLGTYIVQ